MGQNDSLLKDTYDEISPLSFYTLLFDHCPYQWESEEDFDLLILTGSEEKENSCISKGPGKKQGTLKRDY